VSIAVSEALKHRDFEIFHIFREYLELDLTLSQDKLNQVTSVAVAHLNAIIGEFRRLFLVEDLVDSIKFGAFLWFLTYVGAMFNGMTLIILGELNTINISYTVS
jgi:reticulon-1